MKLIIHENKRFEVSYKIENLSLLSPGLKKYYCWLLSVFCPLMMILFSPPRLSERFAPSWGTCNTGMGPSIGGSTRTSDNNLFLFKPNWTETRRLLFNSWCWYWWCLCVVKYKNINTWPHWICSRTELTGGKRPSLGCQVYKFLLSLIMPV